MSRKLCALGVAMAAAVVVGVHLSRIETAPMPMLAQASATVPTPWLIDNNIIPRITCFGPDGSKVGTGIIVDAHRMLTAKHVADGKGICSADGATMASISGLEGHLDFVDVKLNNSIPYETRAVVSCEGFKEGDLYLATGYALAVPRPVTQLVIGTSTKDDGTRTYLRGSFTPGMSGGPVFDLRGRLVGIVNAYSEKGITLAYSVAIKDTFLCRNSAGAPQ